MTLPVASRSWTITKNLSVAQEGTAGATNKTMTWRFVESLRLYGGMTIDYCCNGTIAGTKGDGINRWTDSFDIVGATPGTNHSWFVGILQGGALGYICIDKDSASDGGGGAPGSIYWSPSAGFTGGSTSARPTATDEQEITTSTQLWNTTNGSYTYHIWLCTTSGSESVRFAAIHSSNTGGPDNMFCVEKAAAAPTTWTPPIIATFRSGGAASVADRGNWTAVGWKTRVAGVNRTPVLVGDTPPTNLNLDGDRVAIPAGLNETTIGEMGFVEDWHYVADAVTNLATFSDTSGAGGWIVFDEILWPWDRSATSGGNIAGGKLRVNFLPVAESVAPVLAITAPASSSDYLTVNVYDAESSLRVTEVSFRLPSSWRWVVFSDDEDGDGFLPPFDRGYSLSGAGTQASPVVIKVLKYGGWPTGIQMNVRVQTVDSKGNKSIANSNVTL